MKALANIQPSKKIGARDAIIARLRTECSECDTIIARLRTECSERDAIITFLNDKCSKLETLLRAQAKEIEGLRERLNTHSRNSHMPPSSDGPDKPKKKPKKKRKRKRRATTSAPDKGKRQGKGRALLDRAEVDHLHPCKPVACAHCGDALHGEDPRPQRHQVWDLPAKLYEVYEYELHRLQCQGCGHHTRAARRCEPKRFWPTLASLDGADGRSLLSQPPSASDFAFGDGYPDQFGCSEQE